MGSVRLSTSSIVEGDELLTRTLACWTNSTLWNSAELHGFEIIHNKAYRNEIERVEYNVRISKDPYVLFDSVRLRLFISYGTHQHRVGYRKLLHYLLPMRPCLLNASLNLSTLVFEETDLLFRSSLLMIDQLSIFIIILLTPPRRIMSYFLPLYPSIESVNVGFGKATKHIQGRVQLQTHSGPDLLCIKVPVVSLRWLDAGIQPVVNGCKKIVSTLLYLGYHFFNEERLKYLSLIIPRAFMETIAWAGPSQKRLRSLRAI